MQRIVIAGFGFMGRLHAECLRANPSVKITGIMDSRPEAADWASGLELDAPVGGSLAALLDMVEADAVDICLPTDRHREAAEEAFHRGKHVFCEKPIALTLPDAEAMLLGALGARRQLMIGHCLRFWPEYCELERAGREGSLGRLQTLSLQRRSARPILAVGRWTDDPDRCLGAALDLHIHDTDFLVHLLGMPRAVFSRGVRLPSGWDYLSTEYLYDGMAIHAEGGWICPRKWPLQMGYQAVFERGMLVFDSMASPTLRRIDGDGDPEAVFLSSSESNAGHPIAYDAELRYFIERLESGVPVALSTGEDAARSLRVTLAEIESATSGKIVEITP